MLDIKFVRENPEAVKENMRKNPALRAEIEAKVRAAIGLGGEIAVAVPAQEFNDTFAASAFDDDEPIQFDVVE